MEYGYDNTGGLNEQEASTAMSSDDKALLKKCKDWFQESYRNMGARRERWRKNIKLYENDIKLQWSVHSAVQMKFNLTLSTIETQMPIISDHLPTFDVMPKQSNDIPFADGMNLRAKEVESESHFKKRSLDCIHDSFKLSNGMIRILPKPGKDDGVSVDVVDLFTWFPSPDATGMDIRSEATYHIFATPMHVSEVKRLHNIKVNGEGYIDELDTMHLIDEDKADGGHKLDMVLLKECYFMDEDMDDYPNGRKVVWANNKLISDEALWKDATNIPESQKRIPYFMLGNYKSAHALFGIGEPELLRTQVKALNEVMSSIAETIKKTGNPVRKIKRSLWNTLVKKISNVAGEDVVVDHMDDIQWELPPNIPAFTFKFIETVLMLNDIVTGIHDEMRGKQPAGVTSAVAIHALQEAAMARVRYKISNEINPFIEESGKFIIAMLQEYDTSAHEIRKQGMKGTPEFVPYNPNMKVDTNGVPEGQEGFNTESARSLKDTAFDIQVVAGTRMPAGRFAREDIAKEKFKEGIYGIEQYAMASDEPNKEQLIKDYYKSKGLEQLVAFQEEREKAFGKLEKFVGRALEDTESFIGSDQEFLLLELVQDFPDFLNTEEFQALPKEIKERVIIPGFIEGIEGYADSEIAEIPG